MKIVIACSAMMACFFMMPCVVLAKNITNYQCSPASFTLNEGGCECRDCNDSRCLAYHLGGTIKTTKQGSTAHLVLKKKDAKKTELTLKISPPGLFKDYGSKDVNFRETLFVGQESMPADVVEVTVSGYEETAIDKIICEKKKEEVK
jgi:hypothetical protein